MIKNKTNNHRLVTANYLILFFICLNFVLLSCKAQYDQETGIDEIAVRELGKEYNLEFNNDKTYALCQQKRVNDHPNRIIKFIVVKVSSKEISKSGSFQSGYVKWFTNESIEVATSDNVSADLTKTTIQIKSNEQ